MAASELRTTYVEYFLVLELGKRALSLSHRLNISEFGELLQLNLKLLLEARVHDEDHQHCTVIPAIDSLHLLHEHMQRSFVGRQLQFDKSSTIPEAFYCRHNRKLVGLQHISYSLLCKLFVSYIFSHNSFEPLHFLLLIIVVDIAKIIDPFGNV